MEFARSEKRDPIYVFDRDCWVNRILVACHIRLNCCYQNSIKLAVSDLLINLVWVFLNMLWQNMVCDLFIFRSKRRGAFISVWVCVWIVCLKAKHWHLSTQLQKTANFTEIAMLVWFQLKPALCYEYI